MTLPPLIIGTLFGTQEAGLYALAQGFLSSWYLLGKLLAKYSGEGARLLTIM